MPSWRGTAPVPDGERMRHQPQFVLSNRRLCCSEALVPEMPHYVVRFNRDDDLDLYE